MLGGARERLVACDSVAEHFSLTAQPGGPIAVTADLVLLRRSHPLGDLGPDDPANLVLTQVAPLRLGRAQAAD